MAAATAVRTETLRWMPPSPDGGGCPLDDANSPRSLLLSSQGGTTAEEAKHLPSGNAARQLLLPKGACRRGDESKHQVRGNASSVGAGRAVSGKRPTRVPSPCRSRGGHGGTVADSDGVYAGLLNDPGGQLERMRGILQANLTTAATSRSQSTPGNTSSVAKRGLAARQSAEPVGAHLQGASLGSTAGQPQSSAITTIGTSRPSEPPPPSSSGYSAELVRIRSALHAHLDAKKLNTSIDLQAGTTAGTSALAAVSREVPSPKTPHPITDAECLGITDTLASRSLLDASKATLPLETNMAGCMALDSLHTACSTESSDLRGRSGTPPESRRRRVLGTIASEVMHLPLRSCTQADGDLSVGDGQHLGLSAPLRSKSYRTSALNGLRDYPHGLTHTLDLSCASSPSAASSHGSIGDRLTCSSTSSFETWQFNNSAVHTSRSTFKTNDAVSIPPLTLPLHGADTLLSPGDLGREHQYIESKPQVVDRQQARALISDRKPGIGWKWDSHWVAENEDVRDDFQQESASTAIFGTVNPQLSETMTQRSLELPCASISVFDRGCAPAQDQDHATIFHCARSELKIGVSSVEAATDVAAGGDEGQVPEEPFRSDRRWQPVAMAVSMALHEVRRQRRMEKGSVSVPGVAVARFGCPQVDLHARTMPYGQSFLDDSTSRVL